MRHTIEIEGQKYPIKFGYGALRILGSKWNCPGVQSVLQRFRDAFEDENPPDFSFEQGDLVADLILAGVENAGAEKLPDPDDLMNEVLQNPDILSNTVDLFAKSVSQGNPTPRKKAGSKK